MVGTATALSGDTRQFSSDLLNEVWLRCLTYTVDLLNEEGDSLGYILCVRAFYCSIQSIDKFCKCRDCCDCRLGALFVLTDCLFADVLP